LAAGSGSGGIVLARHGLRGLRLEPGHEALLGGIDDAEISAHVQLGRGNEQRDDRRRRVG
jgi:hypothetical protein